MFKVYGIENRLISMPQMKRKKPLRDIMNRYEVMQLLKASVLEKPNKNQTDSIKFFI